MKRGTKYAALDVHQTTTLASVGGRRGTGDRTNHHTHRGAGNRGVLPGDAGSDPCDVRGRDAGAVVARSPGAARGPGGRLRPAREAAAGQKNDQVDADELSELLLLALARLSKIDWEKR